MNNSDTLLLSGVYFRLLLALFCYLPKARLGTDQFWISIDRTVRWLHGQCQEICKSSSLQSECFLEKMVFIEGPCRL